jgi:transcriptional regulator with XRE-family HTH domain
MTSNADHFEDLAQRIRSERRKRGWSREQLAAVAGVSTSFISKVEHHPEQCSFGKLMQVLAGVDLTFDALSSARWTTELLNPPRDMLIKKALQPTLAEVLQEILHPHRPLDVWRVPSHQLLDEDES